MNTVAEPVQKNIDLASGAIAVSQRHESAHLHVTGEAIYTDDSNYDPVRQGLAGFQRSPIRRRFPDR